MSPIRRTLLFSLAFALGSLGSAGAQSKPAGPPSAPVDAPPAGASATLRALEGSGESATGALTSFELTRKLRWVYPEADRDGVEASKDAVIAFDGSRHGSLKATLRLDGGARDVATLERFASESPELGRPPRVAFTARGIELRGVVESLSMRCTGARCEAQVTLLEAGEARVRSGPRAGDDPTRSPDF